MKGLHLAAALIVAGMAGSTFAQNVQNRLDPQNPADVTQASPAGSGATRHLLKQTAARTDSQQIGAMDRYQHHAKRHNSAMQQYQKRSDID